MEGMRNMSLEDVEKIIVELYHSPLYQKYDGNFAPVNDNENLRTDKIVKDSKFWGTVLPGGGFGDLAY